MKVFARKATGLKYLKSNQILCNDNIKKYFIQDNYDLFADLIKNSSNPSYYEFIPETSYLNFFMDIEIYYDKNPEEFLNHVEIIKDITNNLREKFTRVDLSIQVIVLSSHNATKRSYHIIVRADNKGVKYYFKGVKKLKTIITKLFPKWCRETKIIDTSVYREGLFRTYLSSKESENRPLVKDELGDEFDSIKDTFVCYCPQNSEDNIILAEIFIKGENENKNEIIEPIQKDLKLIDKECIKHFIRREYNYKESDFRDIFIDKKINCIVIALDDRFCNNVDREHKSNNQYIVIDTFSCKKKCHDEECVDYKYKEIKFDKLPKEINEIILKCLKVNKHEQELIEKAIDDCMTYISKNFDENIRNIQFDKNEMTFKSDASDMNAIVIRGKCVECKLEHQINTTGYCLKCSVCDMVFPKNQMIPVDDRYKNLNNFWSNYNQLVNNGTLIVNNYYNGEQEFSCYVQLHNDILRNKELTKFYNLIIDGHKVIMISELVSKLERDFKYTRGHWFHFDFSIWRTDEDNIELKKKILGISNHLLRIQQYYENNRENGSVDILKSVKSLMNKIYKPGFQDEIIKGAKMYYIDEDFYIKLNSKKHLVPFRNGVFDLLTNKFRTTTKDDYINLTLGYEYSENTKNTEVYNFLNQVLPDVSVRDYVLKKMSECLNGDIPNTNFLMFIGDGANGKTQLLNLMKATMGEFGEKVEVTLLTRKRNNANEANTEKIKLMNKRFAFLSEPEDGEKINIGLLKELTGSEEIVARGLYQESMSFVMEAKLFLACNELPEIKGEDSALWRRIRVVDFPSRFVDEPSGVNEYQIDRTLPSRMREDVTWRQTFINILLSYYNKHVSEPNEVKLRTNEYREENNPLQQWLDDNIVLKEDCVVNLRDICLLFFCKEVSNREKTKVRKEIEKWIVKKYPHIDKSCKESRFNGVKYNGWRGLSINGDI